MMPEELPAGAVIFLLVSIEVGTTCGGKLEGHMSLAPVKNSGREMGRDRDDAFLRSLKGGKAQRCP